MLQMAGAVAPASPSLLTARGCAGTFAFDYPSVKVAARHVHSLLLQAAGSTAAAEAGPVASLQPDTSLEDGLLVSVFLAGQLPAAGTASAGDAISAVPYGRWDTEALRQGKVRSDTASHCRSACCLSACHSKDSSAKWHAL